MYFIPNFVYFMHKLVTCNIFLQECIFDEAHFARNNISHQVYHWPFIHKFKVILRQELIIVGDIPDVSLQRLQWPCSTLSDFSPGFI